jgi:hypothetical protein
MGRYLVMALGVAAGIVLGAGPAAAQVDIGVWTPNGGGRVVLGAPRVYYPAPVYVYPGPRPYIVERHYYPYPRRFPPGRARGHYKAGKGYYYDYPRYAARGYRDDRYVRQYDRDRPDDRRRRRGRR